MSQYQTEYDPILQKMGIANLNEMQLATITAATEHNNVILFSNTGTGKTLAFLLAVHKQLTQPYTGTTLLIIVPSRELAMQIEKVYKTMGLPQKITCCYGGHKRETEENNLTEAPTIIVGTPGRLADHLKRFNINKNTITTVILDEFDKLLEQNFGDEMEYILNQLKNVSHKILTSATELKHFPSYLNYENAYTLNYLAEQKNTILEINLLRCKDKDKLAEAFQLLCYIGAKTTILFCNHRESVERVSLYLTQNGLSNQYYHGAMEQQERDSALCKFRNGTVNYLVTTDLASRGLDIPNIRHIIHYHIPSTEEIFTHRNGRTARMDASGTVTILLSAEEVMPNYVPTIDSEIILPTETVLPPKPKWSTLFVAAGKKDKVNKIDIVGFLTNKGNLKKEDIGIIDVKDFFSFVAVKKTLVNELLLRIKMEKIKNKKVTIVMAK